MPSQRLGRSSVLASAFIVLAAPSWAHHGIGRFDPTRELSVEKPSIPVDIDWLSIEVQRNNMDSTRPSDLSMRLLLIDRKIEMKDEVL